MRNKILTVVIAISGTAAWIIGLSLIIANVWWLIVACLFVLIGAIDLTRITHWQLENRWPSCKHEFFQDKQITVLRCDKCGIEGRWMGTKDLYISTKYTGTRNP